MKKRLLDFWYYKIVENLAWCFCELSFRMGVYFSNENESLDDVLIDSIQYQFYKLGCYLYGFSTNYYLKYNEPVSTPDWKKSLSDTENRK